MFESVTRRTTIGMLATATSAAALVRSVPAWAQSLKSINTWFRRPVRPEDKPHPLAAAVVNKTIVGYCDQITVRPGEAIRFFASTYAPGDYTARLFRVTNGDSLSDPSRFKVDPVAAAFEGRHKGRHQPLFPGSYATIDKPDPRLDRLQSFTAVALVKPTLGKSIPQYALSRWDEVTKTGWAIGIDERGEGAVWVSNGSSPPLKLATSRCIYLNMWTVLGASYDAETGEVRIYDILIDDPNFPFDLSVEHVEKVWEPDPLHYVFGNRRILAGGAPVQKGPVRIGAACGAPMWNKALSPAGLFNGRIDGTRITSKVLGPIEMVQLATMPNPQAAKQDGVVACWDFSRAIGTDEIHDLASPAKGRTVNWPQRGMRGYHWKASKDWRKDPQEFTALYCHDDDLLDAAWQEDFSYKVPANLKSGIYAVELRHGTSEHWIPFLVAPPKGKRNGDILFVVPTGTYLSYNNHEKRYTQIERYPAYVYNYDDSAFHLDHPEFSKSIYDNHTDGTPIQISTWLRPSFSITLKSWLHLITGDTQIVEWLDHTGLPYDVIGEELIDREGYDLIKGYRVLLTGQHPEYNSERTHRAIDRFMSAGGRFMYMGGNGFRSYNAWHPTLPAFEIRKSNQTWVSAVWPKDESLVMEFDKTEWKNTASWCVKSFGVSSRGDMTYYRYGSAPYKALPAWESPRVRFVVEGVKNPQQFGDYGAHFGGAAGDEVDAFSPDQGAPSHALEIARSFGVAPPYYVDEAVARKYQELRARPNEFGHASLVFFETPSGGAVFSFSSIAWAGALSHNNFDNDIARISSNVLKRFVDPKKFVMPA